MNTVLRAKAIVERYAESRLFDKDGANGAKFSLANNFRDWREKQEISSTNVNANINTEVPDDPAELKKMVQELSKELKMD
jgi:hypothetical protein